MRTISRSLLIGLFLMVLVTSQPASVQTASSHADADTLVMGGLVNVSQSDVTSAYVRTASSSRFTYAVWSEGGRIVFRRKLVDNPDFGSVPQ